MNVFARVEERAPIGNSDFRKSFLPNRSPKSELFTGSEGKASLDKLHGFLNCDLRAQGNKQVKMIGHDHEFVQKVRFLCAVVIKNVNEQVGSASGLK